MFHLSIFKEMSCRVSERRPIIVNLCPQSNANSSSSKCDVIAGSSNFHVPEPQHSLESKNLCISDTFHEDSSESENESWCHPISTEDCSDTGVDCIKKRKFATKWKILFPFIEYDPEKKVMYCKVCKQFASNKQKGIRFVIGTDNFRRTSIQYHEKSALHAKCQKMSDTASNGEPIEIEMLDYDKRKLSLILKLVYFSIRMKSPYSYYPLLCEAQKKEGVDLGPAYTSHQGVVPLFAQYIAWNFEKELTKRLSTVEKFSLILDHAFSRTIESHELVYLKYLKGDVFETVFIGTVESNDSLSCFYDNLTKLFHKYNFKDWVQNVVYVWTDIPENCPVSIDEFVSLLKEKSAQNFICNVKFLPHKFWRCSDVLFKRYTNVNNFCSLMYDIFWYCSKLTDYKRKLSHINKALDSIEQKYGSLPKNEYVYLTFETLDAMKEDWFLFVKFLKEENDSLLCSKLKQIGLKILSLITKSKFLWELALILDILTCLNDFSIKIQNQELMPFSLYHEIQNVCNDIKSSVKGKSAVCQLFLKEMSNAMSSFKNVSINLNCTITETVNEMRELGNILVNNIKRSFPCLSLLKNCHILDTRNWPKDESLSTFGTAEISKLYVVVQGTEENLQLALSEWCTLTTSVNLCFPADTLMNPNLAIINMINVFSSELPLVTTVLEKVLLLNFSCCEMQRGYHEMNMLKSNERCTLSIKSLQNSMIISMHGPLLSEFDPIPAIKLWLDQCKRRYRKRSKHKMNSLNVVNDCDKFLGSFELTQ